jgi:hypothetical protein
MTCGFGDMGVRLCSNGKDTQICVIWKGTCGFGSVALALVHHEVVMSSDLGVGRVFTIIIHPTMVEVK